MKILFYILPALGTAARCQSLAFSPFCEGPWPRRVSLLKVMGPPCVPQIKCDHWGYKGLVPLSQLMTIPTGHLSLRLSLGHL